MTETKWRKIIIVAQGRKQSSAANIGDRMARIKVDRIAKKIENRRGVPVGFASGGELKLNLDKSREGERWRVSSAATAAAAAMPPPVQK